MDAFQGTPEFALLLACAGAGAPERCIQLRHLAQSPGLDWKRLVQQAEHHALRSLLYGRLQESCPDIVPAPVLEKLKSDAGANARRSLQLTAELLRVLALLQERSIRALSYKGPVLSSQAYGNLALREFLDLDILVPAGQFPAAKQALLSAGYQSALALTQRQERSLLRSNCEYVLDHPERQCTVELHWRIAPRHFAAEFDFDQLWARCRRIPLAGSEVSTLADEDLLLVLSVHAAKHLWECLCWTCDIAELVRARPELDWDQVVARAQKLGILRFQLVSLHLSRELMGVPLPAIVGKAIERDPKVGALSLAVRERMWAVGSSVSLADHWLLLRARERWQDKVRYAGRLAFTPGVSEWELLELPAPLWPLYFAVRLGRVMGKLLRGLWRPSVSAPAAPPLNRSPGSPRP
jgi:hypothetical protein